mmetsp:Transcript_35978/g.101898  ORF Transcript_35978/g.101898 Transcript_35978/m.101898 type:complete len:214 (-) Transcript_35978:1228-1869(-)
MWQGSKGLLPIEVALTWEAKKSPEVDLFMSSYLKQAWGQVSEERRGDDVQANVNVTDIRREFATALMAPKILVILHAEFREIALRLEDSVADMTPFSELWKLVTDIRNEKGEFPESMFQFFSAVRGLGNATDAVLSSVAHIVCTFHWETRVVAKRKQTAESMSEELGSLFSVAVVTSAGRSFPLGDRAGIRSYFGESYPFEFNSIPTWPSVMG